MFTIIPEISDADALLIEAAFEGNMPEGEDFERFGTAGFIERDGRAGSIWEDRPKGEPVKVSEWASVALDCYIERTLPEDLRLSVIEVARHQALRSLQSKDSCEQSPPTSRLAHRRMYWLLARRYESVAKDWDRLRKAMGRDRDE